MSKEHKQRLLDLLAEMVELLRKYRAMPEQKLLEVEKLQRELEEKSLD